MHLVRLYQDQSSKYAAGTVRHLRTLINMVLARAVRHESIRSHPGLVARRPKSREERKARARSHDDLTAAFAVLREYRAFAAVALIAALGLRHGEALGLRWRDVDLEAGTLSVNGALINVRGHPVP